MATTSSRPVRFRVICDDPPTRPGFEFGLQDKDGRLDPGVRGADRSLAFEALAKAVEDAAGRVRLHGAAIHGRPDERFLYLSVRPTTNPNAPWLSRMKVPLPPLHSADLPVATEPPTFEVRIRATGGGTVRLPPRAWTRA